MRHSAKSVQRPRPLEMPDVPPSGVAQHLEAVNLTPPQQALVKILRNTGGSLFAVLDATREPLSILGMLRASGEEYQSLYEGTQAQVLEAFAPYLVRLTENSKLLENVIAHGWGKNWGIFALSGADFQAVRRHFRTFLMVKGPNGQRLYFRYYDPRVLRVYLPTCDAAETQFIFGPVAAYLCESETPDTLLTFRPGPEAPRREFITLTGTPAKESAKPIIQQTQGTESLRTALASS
jgi:Domain of unknown function (DUF4123)